MEDVAGSWKIVREKFGCALNEALLFRKMLLSRGATLLKSVHRVSAVKPTTLNSAQIRNVWCYRRVPPPDRVWITLTELAGGIMWWWVLWHLWHDFDHIIGHFPYPKPYEWTDEELGIPPDEEL